MRGAAAVRRKKGNRRQREPLLRRAAGRAAGMASAVLVLAGAASLLYGGWRLYGWALSTPRLSVRRIVVEGAKRSSVAEIRALTGLREGENILSFSAGEVARRVERAPWVLSASVKRVLPDTVRVVLRERRPAALVRLEGDLYVMDDRGGIIERLRGPEVPDLPVVTGLERRDLEVGGPAREPLLRLIALLGSGAGPGLDGVSEINMDPLYGLTICTLQRGLRVRLGTRDLGAALGRYERLRRAGGEVLRRALAVDVRRAGEAIVRYDHDVVPRGGGRA